MVTSKKGLDLNDFPLQRSEILNILIIFPLVNDNERSNAITFNLRKNSNI